MSIPLCRQVIQGWMVMALLKPVNAPESCAES
jgi:hypothetical protein